MNNIIVLCTIVLIVAACIMFCCTKIIAARMYCLSMGIDYDKSTTNPLPSPYGIIPAQNYKGVWGYVVTKNNKPYSNSSLTYPVYETVSAALHDLNTYELIDGCKVTKLEDME